MVGDVPQTEIVALYAELHDVLDRIDAADASPASDTESIEVAVAHELAARRMSGLGHQRVLDVSDRGAHMRAGYRSLHDFMAGPLRIANPTMRRKHMEALVPMHSLHGEPLPPKCPETAAAVAEGAIGPEHVQKILEALNRIPAAIPAEHKEFAERTLAEGAREFTPRGVAELGARILAHLDPDGSVTDDADRARRRGLSVGEQDAQLMSTVRGSLDPLTRSMFDVVLDAWAAPGMNNPDDEQSPQGSKDDTDPEVLKDAAGRDHRSPAQRNHDAFKALLTAVLDGGLLGRSHRGLPPHLIIKITETQLREQAGIAETAGGACLPIRDVIDVAARAQMHLAVFADHTPEILYLGRASRFANRSQRFALFARDGSGCTCPDCTQPFTHLEAHHAHRDWADGGFTDINALAGACPPDNRRVGPKPGQYRTHIVTEGPDTGRPAWTLNTDAGQPSNPPRINRLHHVAESFTRHLHGDTSPPDKSPPHRVYHRQEERRRVPRLVSAGWSVREIDWDTDSNGRPHHHS
ncbi:DUF222 domain-containing protein [Gordonia sp. CPCC 206044]|uniref:HNH endonuclease signature motif containing protein n=1 Tax=Gordonia sp. CPCC 206044 TaxID=3140793 RepID=UPI003AF405F5